MIILLFRLQEMQRQARATIELMRETYSRIRSDEEKKKGLVILRAMYGKLPTGKFKRLLYNTFLL